ncbi:histamine H3 receptor-like [Pyxicephalus adspersus]
MPCSALRLCESSQLGRSRAFLPYARTPQQIDDQHSNDTTKSYSSKSGRTHNQRQQSMEFKLQIYTNEAVCTELPESVKIVIFVLIAILVLLIILGNSLVMMAFIVDKRLRTPSNLLLLNMAICDFFLGAISIPLYSPYKFTKQWKLGKFLCKFWLVSDYTVSTASVYNIVLISCDRYLSVTKAVFYRSSQNKKSHAVLKMAIVWILSFLVYTPAIFIYDKNFPENICLVGFNSKSIFLFTSSCLDFFLPLIGISFFNLSIYWNILKRSIKKSKTSKLQSLNNKGREEPYVIAAGNTFFALGTDETKKGMKDSVMQWFNKEDPACCTNGVTDPNLNRLSRDKKVAKSLAILVLVFILCWAPYSIMAVCREYCYQPYVSDVTTWLLWINSAINPVLYPLCHKSFKRAFSLIAKKCGSICHINN